MPFCSGCSNDIDDEDEEEVIFDEYG